nr:MAG TPA: hypothetical protein [Caudoviricetes sp.]
MKFWLGYFACFITIVDSYLFLRCLKRNKLFVGTLLFVISTCIEAGIYILSILI